MARQESAKLSTAVQIRSAPQNFFIIFERITMSSKPVFVEHPNDVPLPIVQLGRWVNVVLLSAALLLQQPLLSTLLLIILLAGVFDGARLNLLSIIGKQVLSAQLQDAEREDYRLIRFNNAIAISLLVGAQVAFLLGSWLVGWIFLGVLIIASVAAIAGFCLGCVIFYQLKLYRYKFLGERS